ncbi:PIG-L deacetylase family protein [Desulforhabdus sp. TSK]|uniref:PIG-L deacetylase family protein n=1 Tax=Desulforhabdus sp. TSK TaxID=2925014 RepID=UPI001FC85DDE|nr:PIG-L family deacetylase [Desulforhabdus sp. TSK]GKT10375.1 hypothetical protein DSTSK_36800 [Desulforhabdus sp. TSK]
MRRKVWLMFALLALFASHAARAAELRSLEPPISQQTRLLVFSPHPDDECLGAGGLIQRVLSEGGKVKVAFMTSGDGYPEGVEMEEHISHPKSEDYLEYGKEREEEAIKALTLLGMQKQDIVFLGFPDGGLNYLLWKYRSDPQAYTSPFTLKRQPMPKDMIVPDTQYNGRDLTKEIEQLLLDFRPTLVASTSSEDLHPDHSSTYYFVNGALKALKKKGPSSEPKMITFLIHFGQWPVGQGSGTGSRMNPPEEFTNPHAQWISFKLQPGETRKKREAILQYHTQMLVLGRFLLSFGRSNELFILE